MTKRILLLCFLFGSIVAFGQLKTLSLDDAVMQQNRLFRADKLSYFAWIPSTTKYTYLTDAGKKILTSSTANEKALELISLEELNKALSSNLKTFFSLAWKDANTFIISNETTYYEYNIVTKSGKKTFELPQKSDNAIFNFSNSKIAFTDKNNLFVVDNNNEKIAITQETNENIVSGQFIARNEFGTKKGIFWSPKDNFLAFYQKDQTEVADYPLLDITETPGKLDNIKYPMAGQKSEKPSVGIYNFLTKKSVYIKPKGKEDAYLTNLSWTPDEKYVVIAELNREQNNLNLNLYDSQTGTFVRTILNETSEKWVEPEHPAFFPSKQSNNLVWISESDGFNNLYYYSIEGKLIKKLTENKFPVRDIVGSNTSGTEIYFTATGENPTNMLGYKVDLKGKQTQISKDLGVHLFIPNAEGTWFMDEFSNHSTPSKSLLYDAKGNVVTAMVSNNKYQDYVIGTADIKTIKAADGTTDLYTRLIKPSNFDASKKYPVLVYVYGGPHAQLVTNSFLDGASLWMYWMAEQGYLVFSVDNRGSDNRGVAFESVIHRQLGVNEMEDQINGVEYLKSLPYVDQNRLAVHGWSFGGFITTSLMLKKPDVFKVGVAGGPVTDWKFYEIMYGERYMDTPKENPLGFESTSTLNFVKDLKGKLLLIHGTSDDVVVMQNNFALVKKFIEAGKQIDFFPYPMHKHNVQGKDRVHLMKKVLDYVIENNK